MFNVFKKHGPSSEHTSTSTKTHYEDGVPVTVTTVTKTVDGVTTTTTTTTRGGNPPEGGGHHAHPEQLEDQMRQLQLQEEQEQQQQQQQQQQQYQQPQPEQHHSGHHFPFFMQAEEVHADHHERRKNANSSLPLHRLIGQDVEDFIENLEKRSIIVGKGYKEQLEFSDSDFEHVDKHARSTPASVTHTIESLAKHLTSPFHGNELFQHRAIFTWIAENVTYDTKTFLQKADTPQDAETALRSRHVVCAGYTNLYEALSQVAGLKSKVIHGYGRGYGSSPKDKDVERDSHSGKPTGHAWNSIEVQGNIFLVDSTWGSGHVDPSGRFIRGYNSFYFGMKPKVAIYSHLPGDPENQFISPPLTVQEFLQLPYVKAPYFRAKLRVISPKPRLGEIHTKDGIVDVYVEGESVGEDETIFGHIAFEGHAPVDALSQRVGGFGKGRKVWWIHALCPARGEGKLELFLVKGNNPGPNTLTYHVYNEGSVQHGNLTTRFASNLQYAILHPLHHPKPVNTPIRFEIMIFNPDNAPASLIVMRAGSHGKGRMDLPKSAIIDGEIAMYETELTFPEKGEWNIYYEEDQAGSLSGLAMVTIA